MNEQTLEFEKQAQVPKHKQHWRAVAGKEFLVGEELPEAGIALTIKSVTKEEVQSKKGVEEKAVICFEKTKRKIIANVTNLTRISEVLGSPYPVDWIGKQITFIPERLSFFGKSTLCIRVK